MTFDTLPEVMWQATVASEDRTFWENNGVDFQGIVRAALANLEAGEIVQGASTITQQVIDYARVLREEGGRPRSTRRLARARASRPLDPDAPATEEEPTEEETDVCQPPEPNNSTDIQDKIRENILAMQVTAEYPGRAGKERILETYLNLIYYGNGSYGIKAAAANYFGLTDLAEMSVAQAAFLAALPQAPSFLDPYQNPNGEPGSEEAAADALRERNLVLGAMREEGYITARRGARGPRHVVGRDEAEPADERPPGAALQLPRPGRGRAHPRRAAGSRTPRRAVRTGGYRITTSLDMPLQQEAKRLVHEVGRARSPAST